MRRQVYGFTRSLIWTLSSRFVTQRSSIFSSGGVSPLTQFFFSCGAINPRIFTLLGRWWLNCVRSRTRQDNKEVSCDLNLFIISPLVCLYNCTYGCTSAIAAFNCCGHWHPFPHIVYRVPLIDCNQAIFNKENIGEWFNFRNKVLLLLFIHSLHSSCGSRVYYCCFAV